MGSSSSTTIPSKPPPSVLSALAIFKNILNQELIRSVHVYRLEEEGKEKEKWVEREFLFSPTSYIEICAPIPHPLLSLESTATATSYCAGQMIGLWVCILAFDSTTPSSSPIPPLLSFSRNPKLKSVPTLACDLQKVFQLSCRIETVEPVHFAAEGICAESEDNSSSSMGTVPMFYQHDFSLVFPVTAQGLLENKQNDQDLSVGVFLKKKRAATEHVASIALADIAKYFDLPITEASRNLNIGLTVLKKKCREFGIPRWPHRKIKSLDTLIHNLQEEVSRQERENKAAAVRAATRRQRLLESEKEGIERRPFMELQRETKRFRQDVFKRRHRAKALSKNCQQPFANDHDQNHHRINLMG